jgi:pimeloyl-ACP methyl ester carboxylesterase
MSADLRPLLERDGCVLHGIDTGGGGAPLLLSHGAGADSGMFEPQLAVLREAGYRVVAWDLRGHGASRSPRSPITPERAVDDTVALIGELGLVRPVLIGQSLGGNLSQAVVRRHPELASALIVVDSAWNAQPLSALDRALLGLATPTLRAIPWSRLPRLMAEASATTERARRYADTVFRRSTKPEFLDAWRTTAGLLDPDPGYRTPVPLLLLRGERDRTGTIAKVMPAWAKAEGVSEVVIPGAGHLANLDAPDEVNAAILTFLRGL